eukprot:6176305-Pleurochrysis_carterae.AAC.4
MAASSLSSAAWPEGPKRSTQDTPKRERDKRGDPSRHTPSRKSKAFTGPSTIHFVKCRHCGGTHWRRDCPKRLKSRSDKVVRAARVDSDATV